MRRAQLISSSRVDVLVQCRRLGDEAALALSMLDLKNIKPEEWTSTLKPMLSAVCKNADKVIADLLETCSKDVQIEEEKEEADDAEQLCDCQFSLAYGNRVLLQAAADAFKGTMREALKEAETRLGQGIELRPGAARIDVRLEK